MFISSVLATVGLVSQMMSFNINDLSELLREKFYLQYEREETVEEEEIVETAPNYVAVQDENNPYAIPTCTDERVKEWNPVIIDLDFYSDVDDIMSLRMLAELDNLGYCDIKAAGMCVNGFEREVHNTLGYSGLFDVPIGKSSMDVPPDDYNIMDTYTTFYNCDDSLVIKDAVQLYKDVLRESEHPVKIITTGYLTNIQLLLQDEEGLELVRNNCEGIYIVGGSYPSGMDNNFFYTPQAASAIRYVIDNSPAQLVFITNLTLGTRSDTGLFPGFGGVFCGRGLYENDPNQYDIVTKALQYYMDFYEVGMDKPAGDPMGVWIAVMPEGFRKCYLDDCNIYISENGSSTFSEELEPNCKVAWLESYDGGRNKFYCNVLDWLLTRAIARKHPELNIVIGSK